jgi:hypothetical protein
MVALQSNHDDIPGAGSDMLPGGVPRASAFALLRDRAGQARPLTVRGDLGQTSAERIGEEGIWEYSFRGAAQLVRLTPLTNRVPGRHLG